MTVRLRTRRLLAFLSACGFALSVVAYIGSFSVSLADAIFRWWIVLLPGWMALFVPIYVLEYPASRKLAFSLKGFARGMPSWVAPCAWLLSLIALAHFAWFHVHAPWGVPEVRDGQYVLISHGHILKVLTQAEYVKLRAAGARMFASVMILFYFMPMMYWWFRRDDRTAG